MISISRGMHLHLEEALNKSENFRASETRGKFFCCCVSVFWILCETGVFGWWHHQLWHSSTETRLPGWWDWSSELVGGDDSAGNTPKLQGNKTEWKQWGQVHAEDRNVWHMLPVLALHTLVSCYEAAAFWGLSSLQWCGTRWGWASCWHCTCFWCSTAPSSCSTVEMHITLGLPSPLLPQMNFYLLPFHRLLAELWGTKTQREENVAAKTLYEVPQGMRYAMAVSLT